MEVAEYVHQRNGEFFVGESRVTLRSIIADRKRGRTPEQIVTDFPGVPLATVYGAIATYLEHQEEFDTRFREADAAIAVEQAAAEAANPAFYSDMRARIAQVRPQVLAVMREHGILPSDEAYIVGDQENPTDQARHDDGRRD